MTGIPEQLILERKIEELDMYRIADHLCVDGLKSGINAGVDDLIVGEVITRTPQDLKAHLGTPDDEGVDFGAFVCPYNILTHIEQRLKGEETLSEVVKHNKCLEILNMSEYGTIKVYTFSIVSLGLFRGKRYTKSDIGPLPDYSKWCNKSLQMGIG